MAGRTEVDWKKHGTLLDKVEALAGTVQRDANKQSRTPDPCAELRQRLATATAELERLLAPMRAAAHARDWSRYIDAALRARPAQRRYDVALDQYDKCVQSHGYPEPSNKRGELRKAVAALIVEAEKDKAR